jgi:Di-haem oxidoreductase, putative peroxidase
MKSVVIQCIAAGLLLTAFCARSAAREGRPENSEGKFQPAVPRTWEDQAMAALEVPLANPIGSPKHVPADYYYRIPIRPIYKSYPVYAPGHEPSGYMDWLRHQEPQLVWDDAGHTPPLKTEEDWIKAGEIVFESPLRLDFSQEFNYGVVGDYVRDRTWYRKMAMPVSKDGILPFDRYVIRTRERVELSGFSCASCHTRVMPDGSVLKGAQGNFPFEIILAHRYRASVAKAKDHVHALSDVRANERCLYAVPWLRPDPLANIDRTVLNDIAVRHDAIPAGVIARHGTNPDYPAQVPDLIGVKDRRYLDHTGLQQHRGPVDLMRYAALNQGADDLSDFDGFIPADFGNFKKRPDPTDQINVAGRYSDEQLYALALYIYSLQPPANPNKFDAVAARGKKVFEREGCAGCHTPPLYTSNKLTPADGFVVPDGADKQYDILHVSVGTDPNLALKTRRGTGYYKVPSLRGLWYRSMFGHSGWCATLEDWFDPRRTRDDYIPTGFKPYGTQSYAVKGHPFGLDLTEGDRAALIRFLKTI